MRFQIELPDHLVRLLRELATENYRPPKQHATFLLAQSIERAYVEREDTRERHLAEVLHEGE